MKVVGIIDRVGGLIKEEGFSEEEIQSLLLSRNGNSLFAEDMIPFEEVNSKIWGIPAEIFIPAAASRLVSKEQIQQMIDNSLEVIASGANVPFADREIFYGPVMEYADQHVAVIPDFVANCGMARVFAYLMQPNIEISDDSLFQDVSDIIRKALEQIHSYNPETKINISSRAYELALRQLL